MIGRIIFVIIIFVILGSIGMIGLDEGKEAIRRNQVCQDNGYSHYNPGNAFQEAKCVEKQLWDEE